VFLPAGQEILIPALLKRWMSPDVVALDPAPALRMAHRRRGGEEVFLVINESPEPWRGRLGFAASGVGEHLDLTTGTWTSAVAAHSVAVTLEGYGAAGFRFQGRAKTDPPLASLKLPTIHWQARPTELPSVGRGEWVRDQFERLDGVGESGRWRSRATLRKGNVDVHLFVRFPVRDGSGWADSLGVAFDLEVPSGQQSATQLLVVVAEQGGGDFIATTPCSLGGSHRGRVVVPFTQFSPAGWAPDPDGRLDTGRLAEVRVGWGGYFGHEGETIEFTTGAPVAVRMAEP
jgi:hypothetical protein